MKLMFLHGWGFDATIWNGVRAALAPIETIAWDRGYFGPAIESKVEAPFIAIGHSLGSLLLANDPPRGCIGLVVINGFDRFVGEGLMETQMLERMQSGFAISPRIVLNRFRRRVGGDDHHSAIDTGRLAADLDLLRTLDAKGRLLPDLVLHGGKDAILPRLMRDSVFADAERVILAEAGHLLPLSHPRWCADRIRELIA